MCTYACMCIYCLLTVCYIRGYWPVITKPLQTLNDAETKLLLFITKHHYINNQWYHKQSFLPLYTHCTNNVSYSMVCNDVGKHLSLSMKAHICYCSIKRLQLSHWVTGTLLTSVNLVLWQHKSVKIMMFE